MAFKTKKKKRMKLNIRNIYLNKCGLNNTNEPASRWHEAVKNEINSVETAVQKSLTEKKKVEESVYSSKINTKSSKKFSETSNKNTMYKSGITESEISANQKTPIALIQENKDTNCVFNLNNTNLSYKPQK
ncbi:6847_t:CDS:2 [Cetraspora pellucida]|uniref:6847_t:CDS:1 n=1 Tax=Cetraspora pellucida TaxID=1433469 RepID=A0ACA9M3F6_9GLOM|nr:6847_t:CDS:2 [Cetraspora pellucida]